MLGHDNFNALCTTNEGSSKEANQELWKNYYSYGLSHDRFNKKQT